MRIAISSGHGMHVRGASGYLDEVNEARKVVDKVADLLAEMGVGVVTFHDGASRSQSENLKRIVDWHNAQSRELDVSVHFNAYQTTSKPMGTEVLYVTQQALATAVAKNIAEASGLINRGAKKRSDLYFLNNTRAPAVLLEICFVDSSADAAIYTGKFAAICGAIAEGLTGIEMAKPERPEDLPPPDHPPPEPERETETTTIDITTDGNVIVRVNGVVLG